MLYWNHVEYFPEHIKCPEKALDFALRSLIQGQVGLLLFTNKVGRPRFKSLADGMTSQSSTYVFSPKDCEKYIDILKGKSRYYSTGESGLQSLSEDSK